MTTKNNSQDSFEKMQNLSKSEGLNTQNIDANVRIQDDLFRHVNGTWINSTKIPDDRPVDGAFYELRDAAEKNVKDLIEQTSKESEDPQKKKIANAYSSFMDKDMLEQRGANALTPVFEKIDKVKTKDELLALMGEFERSGYPHLFNFGVDIDAGNPDRNLAHLFQSGLTLPDESYYKKEEYKPLREEFLKHNERLLAFLGDDISQDIFAQPDKDSQEILDLETKIANHHWDNVTLRDPQKTYNLTTFQQLLKDYPYLERYFNSLGIEEELLEEVIVQTPDFFAGVEQELSKNDLALWKKWLALKVAHSLAPLLSEKYVNENFAFFGQTLTGTPVLRESWKRGVSFVESMFGEIVGQLYVEKYFPQTSKKQVKELVDYLLKAYRESITNLTWMGEETKKKALEKLDQFRVKIGYPDTWIDYSALDAVSDDPVENARRSAEFNFNRDISKLGKPVDKNLWHMTPQTVNAYYDPTQNEIVFPAAILQAPFFDPDADDSLNFGGIGAVIGHEIGHGFDDQGSQFDGKGALNNWWTDTDRATFNKLTQKLVQQYNKLSPQEVPDQKVNGSLTLGENIGDLGGLSISVKAYRLCQKDKKREENSQDIQNFFLNWGVVWRQKIRPEMAAQLLVIDPHSPAEFRCNAVVGHIDDFYNAFNVTDTDKLWIDPHDRIVIW